MGYRDPPSKSQKGNTEPGQAPGSSHSVFPVSGSCRQPSLPSRGPRGSFTTSRDPCGHSRLHTQKGPLLTRAGYLTFPCCHPEIFSDFLLELLCLVSDVGRDIEPGGVPRVHVGHHPAPSHARPALPTLPALHSLRNTLTRYLARRREGFLAWFSTLLSLP